MKLEFSMESTKSSSASKNGGSGNGCGGGGSAANVNTKAQDNCYVTQSTSGYLETLSCFYGLISREDAEWVLHDLGCQDGLYLLRESGPDYVLSLCFHNSVLHYRINRLPGGDVSLQGLPHQQYPTPMVLIESVDGLACRPTTPARSSVGKCLPPTHWSLSGALVRAELITRAHNYGLSSEYLAEHLDCDCHFSSSFSPLVVSLVYKSLHEIQPWYHFRLSRADAERRLEAAGHYDGRFLVRERDSSSYAICLSHESRIKHYRIDILPSGMFAIQDGPKFESIISLISHYTLFAGGLWCMLTEPCSRPQDLVRQYAEQSSNALQLTRENLLALHGHSHTHGVDHRTHHHHVQCKGLNRLHHHHHHNNINGSPVSVRSWINSCENSPRSRSKERCCGGETLNRNSLKPISKNCHHCGQRRRRVSNPTNAKLKEWFNTINHKWARIKRQVILHHQRQTPLINEEYGTVVEEVTCCSQSKKQRNNTEATLSRLRKQTEFEGTLLSQAHRYATYGYSSRRQQFGRWQEEPTFGSRYAFNDCEDNLDSIRAQDGVTTKKSGGQDETDNGQQLQQQQPLKRQSTPVGRSTMSRIPSSTKKCVAPALIKSSSIDTIVGMITDPIEEIRRLHLCEHSVDDNSNDAETAAATAVATLRYAQLFENSDPEMCSKNLCNCGDWLLDLDNGCQRLDLFDMPNLDCGVDGALDHHDDEQNEFKENMFQVPYAKSNARELAELFASQALLTPLWAENRDPVEKTHLALANSDSGGSSSGEIHGDPESGLGQTTAPVSSVSGSSGSSSVSSSTSMKPEECLKQEPESWRIQPPSRPNDAITDLLKEFDVCFANRPDDKSMNNVQTLPKTSLSGIPAPSIPPPRPPNFTLGPDELEAFESLDDLIEKKPTTESSKIDIDDQPWPEAPTEAETNIGDSLNGSNQKDIELICLNEQAEEVQETIRRCQRGPICFDPRCITLKRKIGNGYFGDVHLATIPCSKVSGSQINLAVKMLKSSAVPQQKVEILREAQTMAKLDHRHIVRIIGVCEGDPFMLVMELAPLGPLNKYLQNYGKSLTEDDILKLMLQVSRAMRYLEDMSFVHRDLAARNILLVNEQFAKVSDFGMSRALGEGKDYYKARSASKWPLKWYAPECIYYYKFSSKSDVWSYGVALWEAMSRGEMPYAGQDGQDILKMFAENRRLSKPNKCPVVIYQLMWSCWQFKPEERPSFASISDKLQNYLESATAKN